MIRKLNGKSFPKEPQAPHKIAQVLPFLLINDIIMQMLSHFNVFFIAFLNLIRMKLHTYTNNYDGCP